MSIRKINAVTLMTADKGRSAAFYEQLGLAAAGGGHSAATTTFRVGSQAFNLVTRPRRRFITDWSRVIFPVDDVDETYRPIVAAGFRPDFPVCDAPWGERYFHVTDPDGHEISFATPISPE